MGYLSPTVESYLQSAGLHLALFVVCCLVCYYWTEISAAPGRLLESLLQRGLRKTVLGRCTSICTCCSISAASARTTELSSPSIQIDCFGVSPVCMTV
ncbi:hypothetical protein BOX15_Mlig020996g4 [Macrostomum lignano]|uniref:Uncharacterized protein n=1 Tax=Macrostomum lignano TaxID=282301 RepID=A0A267DBX0_9PLAT|nr:hypothetical protein BOX15_Mlig020996g4 [Macrostomum lignano]